MSKHTNGPWETRPGTTGDIKIYMVGAKPSGGAIANVRVPSGMEQTAQANAALIAAAPDLLAVVQELEESAAYWSEYEVPLGILDRLRAAIAKATGVAA